MVTFLLQCGLQNTDHVMPFWLFPWLLKVDCVSHVFTVLVKVQRKERDVRIQYRDDEDTFVNLSCEDPIDACRCLWPVDNSKDLYRPSVSQECMLLPLQFRLYMLELKG